jgi:DNA polymerase-3 subunit delta
MNNFYVFYGEELFLIEKEANKIVRDLFGNDTENKVSKYNMLQTNIDTVIEDACMISLFDDKKVIICTDCFFLTGSNKDLEIDNNLEHLISYIDHYDENTTIIFMVNNSKLDDRKKIVKKLREVGIVKEFNKLKNNELIDIASTIFKENKYEIEYKTIKKLVERIEENVELLHHEIDKLMLYKLDEKKVIDEDIEDIIYQPITDNIFALVDAIIDKDIEKTMNIYSQLLTRNEEPIKIIVILANQFRLIYQTKKLYKLGYSERDIASKLDIHPYRIKLANEVRLDENTLLKYIEQLADLDIDIKTGRISKDIGLELFFLKI